MSTNKKLFSFPDDFLWGVSTSAYQIEGGITCDWSEWEKEIVETEEFKKSGKNPKDFLSGLACDSYNRYSRDFDLVKDLNCSAYRFGIEWSRIEPIEGVWNSQEIEHYRKMLQEARERGIKTVLTLWHWTNPLWLTKKGGWANEDVVHHYSRYVSKIVDELGELVDYWITLNEPLIHVFNGYLIKKFPPQKSSIFEANKVFKNLYKAHNLAYEIIHKDFFDAKVSITQITNYFEPARKWNPLEVLIASIMKYFWNDRFLLKIIDKLDFIGIDYYFHDRIVFYPPFRKNLNKSVNDMGWEIYPEGIYYVLKDLDKYKLPIIIMENGIPDEKDSKRADFIKEHLKYIHKAIEEGVDVKGYFYWSLIDNFEWAAGFGPKFGLYRVDRKTLQRYPRTSAKVYSNICFNNKLEL